MTTEHRYLAEALRKAADEVEEMPEDHLVHTITVTLDEPHTRSTIEYDREVEGHLETAEPIVRRS